MKNKNGFTLIELLAVIVILAIIALIATPMVLKYIKTSKEGSYDSSINNILRAAENYYAGSMLNTKVTYPQNFMFPNNKELGVKGKQPDSGYLTIYEDGSTYLYAIYDEVIYTKLPNEAKAKRYNMVVGDDITWSTDGKGKITKYNMEDTEQKIEKRFEVWISYIGIASSYAMRDGSIEELDYNLSLKENIEKMEQEMDLDRGMLPLELNKEIDESLEIFNTKSAIAVEEAMQMVEDNRDKLPYFSDYLAVANNGGELGDMKVYQLLKDSIENNNLLVIPNYIKHSDGTKEKITSVSSLAFRNGISGEAFNCYLTPTDVNTERKDLIISEGIEVIEDFAFSYCLLNSVTMANSIKEIGGSSFVLNVLKNIVLPNNLERIGSSAFFYNNISGNLNIPKSVITVEDYAFAGDNVECTGLEGTFLAVCKATEGQSNKINSITFEKDSKIETVGNNAFAENKLENITIPKSIKEIGNNSFNCDTLKSATIERAKGSDLNVATDAFGIITPMYKS